MTSEEAGVIVGRLAMAFPRTPIGSATAAEFIRHLLPIPLWAVEYPLDRFLEGAGRSDRDQPFSPSIGELLGGLGFGDGARAHLARAVNGGGTIEQSLRDPSGWEFVSPDGPIPLGVAEAAQNAGRPLPNRPIALPAPTEERAPDVIARFGELAATLRQRRAVTPRDLVPAENPVSIEGLPEPLRTAVLAADGERNRYIQLCRELNAEIDAQRAAHRAEVERLMDAGSTREGRLTAIERLVAEEVADPQGGIASATEAFRRGVAPRLSIRLLRPTLAPPALIDLDGLDGPPEERQLEALVISFARGTVLE